MSQRDNFASGFFLGAIVGGALGGVLGALFASGRLNELTTSEDSLLESNQPDSKARSKKGVLKPTNGHADIEVARRKLEGKIAQLNEAIDDVRQQLGGMNNDPGEVGNQVSSHEPPN